MKVVLTRVEPIGKTGQWFKLHFYSPLNGSAGNAIVPEALTKGLSALVKDVSKEKPVADVDFNQQGRVDQIEKL